MNFQDYLEKLRSKPDHIRKRYSFFISFVITAIIFVFWISSFGLNSSDNSQNLAKTIDKAGSPGLSLVASVGSFLGDIKEIFFGAKKVQYSSIEVIPGRK